MIKNMKRDSQKHYILLKNTDLFLNTCNDYNTGEIITKNMLNYMARDNN